MRSFDMAYVNVLEWTPDHVAEWLRGLEGCILPYVHFFFNNHIDGCQLLNLSPEDLNGLHIFKIGHQELILEAVDLLRQLHYGLTSETLQFLALKLGCKARSLHNELKLNGPQENLKNIKQQRVSTDTLSAVSGILVSVKSLVSWLDRYPFEYQDQYVKVKKAVLKLSIELASTAQRDQFVEKPHHLIKNSSLQLADLCDKVVQEFNDSLIIQPASLDIATIKKKPDEELGLHIQSTYSGVHIISSIKPKSPAIRCSKVEEGDEIVQVNYQTVTGWHLKSFLEAMKEHPTEIHLTLKKRPRHANILGQIIILRPYRIPSKKTAFGKLHKWSDDNSSLHIQEVYSTSNDDENRRDDTNDEDDDDSAFLPDDAVTCRHEKLTDTNFRYRMFPCTPHVTVQRRATVSGASPTISKAPVNIEDLVNGVPSITRKENIIRSISHDPSKLKVSSEKTGINIDLLDVIKCEEMDDNAEKSHKFIAEKKENLYNESLEIHSKFSALTTSNSSEPSSVIINDSNPLTPSIQTANILEDEYIILENKSLERIKGSSIVERFVAACLPNALNDDKKSQDHLLSHLNQRNPSSTVMHAGHQSLPQKKKNSVLCSWEGADTSFCGRRPSAHDISNVIAGSNESEINPVFLRKASKLNCPDTGENPLKKSKSSDFNSYQVVVVGGVPQKCLTVSKGQKNENMFMGLQPTMMSSVEKFGNRRVSCKDLGIGDCQGWLYKQKDKKGFFPMSTKWTKRWIILKKHCLYSYKDRNDSKADCLIFLPGSTVSPAMEQKTRKFCFKICQSSTTFYFATETQSDLSKWMNKMGLAAIAYDTNSEAATTVTTEGAFYSETDDSDDSSSKDYTLGFNDICQNSHISLSDQSELQKRTAERNRSIHDLKNKFLNAKNMDYYIHQSGSNNQSVANYPILQSQTFCSNSHFSYCDVPISTDDSLNAKTHGTPYARTFSYAKATDPQLTDEKMHDLSNKVGYEETDITRTNPYPCDIVISNVESTEVQSDVADEDYNILTLSLGRQKQTTKEITPGLVARMAMSYSNLSHKNTPSTNSVGKLPIFRGAPSPGYVAKISDSFDHLARNKTIDIPNSNQLAKSNTGSRQISADLCEGYPQNSCKRSFSEGHVAQDIHTLHSKSLISSSLLSSQPGSGNTESNCSVPKKLVSRLDRDHYRLYGKKKISPSSMKSPITPDSQSMTSKSERTMRFFPDEIMPEIKQDSNIFCNSTKCNSPKSSSDKKAFTQSSHFWESDPLAVSCPSSKMCVKQYNQSICQQTVPSENISCVRDQIQPTFKSEIKNLYSGFGKGIENIGFYFSDAMKPHVSGKYIVSNDNVSTMLNESAEQRNRQSACYGDSLDSFYSKCEIESNMSPKSATLEAPVSRLNSPFKLFSSPKFMKKLSSPKLDKKNIFKSKKQAKENKKAEQKDLENVQNERKFFGSPRLGRAIFGSPKVFKKTTSALSSNVQTDLHSLNVSNGNDVNCLMIDDNNLRETLQPKDENRSKKFSEVSTASNFNANSEMEQYIEDLNKTSSTSSLNSDASSSILSASTTSSYYSEMKMKPDIAINHSHMTDKFEERDITPETPRTPLKPTMGIAMLGKRRLPSISGESTVSLSSRSSHDKSPSEFVNIPSDSQKDSSCKNDDYDLSRVIDILREADLSLDGVDLRARRCQTMLMHFSKKQMSQLVLELRALQRTLKCKETELDAIDELYGQPVINHQVLVNWIAQHPDLFMPEEN